MGLLLCACMLFSVVIHAWMSVKITRSNYHSNDIDFSLDTRLLLNSTMGLRCRSCGNLGCQEAFVRISSRFCLGSRLTSIYFERLQRWSADAGHPLQRLYSDWNDGHLRWLTHHGIRQWLSPSGILLGCKYHPKSQNTPVM